jgi:DNA-binding SARP family transcriptional activator
VSPDGAEAPRLQLHGRPHLWTRTFAAVPLGDREALMLAYLALQGPTPRAELAALLWPDADEERARGNLRQRIFQLHQRAGCELIRAGAQAALSAELVVEAAPLGAAPTAPSIDAPSLSAGVEPEIDAVPGPPTLLAGVQAVGELQSWLERQRQRQHDAHLAALDSAADLAEQQGDLVRAQSLAQRRVHAAPSSEPGWQRVMRLHLQAGDPAAVRQAFARCEAELRRALDCGPSSATRALLAQAEADAGPGGGLPKRAGGGPGSHIPPVRPPSARKVPRPPRLIGRESECQRMAAVWEAGGGLCLEGEAGLGKSRLLADFLRERHALVVRARPGDTSLPLALLSRLLQALPAAALNALPAGARAELARVLPDLGPAAPESALGLTRLAAALQRLLGSLPAHGAITLAIDDLHFADADSLRLIAAALTALAAPTRLLDETDCQGLGSDAGAAGTAPAAEPLRWLLAYRPAECDATLRAQWRSALGADRCMVLAPLTPEATQALIDSLAAAMAPAPADAATGQQLAFSAEAATALARHTGGNPLFLLETLKAVLDGSGDAEGPTALPLPASVGTLIDQRLARLSAPALELARLAALAGADFSAELAEQVLRKPLLALADAWRELEQAQLLEGAAFVHDLAAEATARSVPAAIGAHLHRAIAAALSAQGAAPARVVRHWLAGGDEAAALPALRAAGDAARAVSLFTQALHWYEQAIGLAEKHREAEAPFELLLAAAECANWLADNARQHACLDRAIAHARSLQQQVAIACSRVKVLYREGRGGEALEEVQTLLARTDAMLEPEAWARLQAAAGMAQLAENRYAGAAASMGLALPYFETHPAHAEAAEFFGDYAVALDMNGCITESTPIYARATALLRERADWPQLKSTLDNLALNQRRHGRMQQALQTLQSSARLAELHGLGEDGHDAMSARALAVVRRNLGHYDAAIALLEAAERGVQTRFPVFAQLVRIDLAATWLQLGQPARAQVALDAALADTGGRFAARAHALQALLLAQRAEAAAPALAAAGAALLADDLTSRSFVGLYRLACALPGGPGESPMRDARGHAAQLHDEALALARAHAQPGAMSIALPALALAADAAARAGVLEAARRHADEALALLARFDPDEIYRGEVWARCIAALLAAGAVTEARAARDEARRWVEGVASRQVPAAFRESFVVRNPWNRWLLAGG